MNQTDYQHLLDWTCWMLANGFVDTQQDATMIAILSQRQITVGIWFPLVMNFDDSFFRIRRRRFCVRPQTRRLLCQHSLSGSVSPM